MGPIDQCCCCKSLSESPHKRWRIWILISLVIWMPFLIMSLMMLDFYYVGILFVLISIYFIPKSVMDLRANTNQSSGCQPDYWYIASSIISVSAMAAYAPFAAGCVENVCFLCFQSDIVVVTYFYVSTKLRFYASLVLIEISKKPKVNRKSKFFW